MPYPVGKQRGLDVIEQGVNFKFLLFTLPLVRVVALNEIDGSAQPFLQCFGPPSIDGQAPALRDVIDESVNIDINDALIFGRLLAIVRLR
tara:strand:+ start:2592 stop:2861 length:270 start_codon:yes stop_codon:yes gene_type:complete